jgi:hypothetical protein
LLVFFDVSKLVSQSEQWGNTILVAE